MRTRNIIVISILLALVSIGTTGCYFDHDRHYHDDDSIVGSGRIATQERTVGPCQGIHIVGAANVHFSQGTPQSVRVEADDNIIDRVVTRSENGNLVVGLEDGSYTRTTVNVYVVLPEIDNLEIYGAGDLTGEGSITSDDLRCYIGGAGNISVAGTANDQTAIIGGAGNIENFNLITLQTTATINGTGNCEVNASQSFNGVINGVGSIIFDGNPAHVESAVNGIGRIVPR